MKGSPINVNTTPPNKQKTGKEKKIVICHLLNFYHNVYRKRNILPCSIRLDLQFLDCLSQGH